MLVLCYTLEMEILAKKIKPPIERFLSALKKAGVLLSRILLGIIIISLILAFYAYFRLVDISGLTSSAIAQTSQIYDRTGEHLLYEIHGEENRKIILHAEIPNSVRVATIAAEDNSFYTHPGIDLKAILRALKADVKNNSAKQGASTITQQLARNVFLSREKTLKRKLMEVAFAIKIEQSFSKDEILDMYLNEVPYGSNAYGIESAAQIFFGKSARDLTLDESALLAALPNATTYYSPFGSHADELAAKQKRILDKMLELKLTDTQAIQTAKETDTLKKILPFRQSIEAPHFVFYVKEQLEKEYGQDMVEKGGLKIYTTLNYDLQKIAEKAVADGVKINGKKYGATNGALVSLDPKTGQILAMVGSVDYFDESIDGQVNVATSPRQPGSSFKPFAYSAAFEKGYQPENILFDVPTNFGPDGSGKDYTPSNYDGGFHGLVSMRQALAMSLNIPAVKTLYLAGIKDTLDLAHRLGISTLNEKNRYGLALVLGGGEVTLLDETSGFGVFANNGVRNPASAILKIEDSQSKIIFENKPDSSHVLNQEIARKINSILSDNNARSLVFGTNNSLVIPGRTVAAKTGTTQDFHDAWTVGYTPSLATGVWVGNNNNDAMRAGADGSYVAAPIWNNFMSQALKNYPADNFTDYDHSATQGLLVTMPELKTRYYDKKTGKKLSEKKRAKMNPQDIETRIELPKDFSYTSDFPAIVEMQNTADPMILRWRESIMGSNTDNSD